MNWDDLATAACLVLVLEGMMPFLSPARWKNTLRMMLTLDDRSVRMVGLGSMLIGAIVLYWVR
ncbi:MAG TPA: DUF2065 domain-containing protein [Pseudomonadales bacterium]